MFCPVPLSAFRIRDSIPALFIKYSNLLTTHSGRLRCGWPASGKQTRSDLPLFPYSNSQFSKSGCSPITASRPVLRSVKVTTPFSRSRSLQRKFAASWSRAPEPYPKSTMPAQSRSAAATSWPTCSGVNRSLTMDFILQRIGRSDRVIFDLAKLARLLECA